jgi:4-amino-4-deoxy-L-arabinose transferase-like glycosyltransferase
VFVGLTILLIFIIRVRLREMPLERDEGEYAYAGQLMLHGVPPYKEAYNMKLPGTYAAYAVIMAIFGRNAAGIHFGLALVNAASIILVFLIGRRLLDQAAGVAAALAFGFMSLSPAVLGLAAHATHFVVLFALLGVWLLFRVTSDEWRVAREEGEGSRVEGRGSGELPGNQLSTINYQVAASGLAFGLAFVMKQHGLFFGVFGMAYLIWESRKQKVESRKQKQRFTLHARRSTLNPFSLLPSSFFTFALGLALPYLFTCLLLAFSGALKPFFFWTVSYAGKYAAAIPLSKGGDALRAALRTGGGPALLFWLVPALAAVMMWWEQRLTATHRFFLTALTLCSFAAMSIGFYFRPHYFILLLPALALLTGVAFSRALYLLRYDRTIELFLAIPILALFPIALGATLLEDGRLYFDISPDLASRYVYNSTIFTEAAKAAQYLEEDRRQETGDRRQETGDRREETGDGRQQTGDSRREKATVAVIGSEPEIYFYCLLSPRHSTPDTRHSLRAATGFIYTYPLMEEHPYAVKMQQQMIEEIERAKPEYVLFVDDWSSWVPWPNCDRAIYDWWKRYWSNELDLVKTIPIEGAGERSGVFADSAAPAGDSSTAARGYIFIFKRR